MKLDDAEEIVREMKGIWHGSYGMVLCPAHADKNPSLSVAQGRKGPMFKCWAGCDFKDIMAALRAQKIEVVGKPSDAADEARSPAYSLSAVERIMQHTRPLAGTLGQRLLIARGLGMDHPCLRFSAAASFGPVKTPRRKGPAILVPMHFEDRLVGVQRVFLDPADRQHHGLFKPVLCSEPRAAMQLAPAGRRLALTEGWEDAIAYRRLFGIPAWGLPGVEWLANTVIPDGVEEVIIAFDKGKAAASAFDRHAARLVTPSRTVRFDPPVKAKDWNAELMRRLHEEAA